MLPTGLFSLTISLYVFLGNIPQAFDSRCFNRVATGVSIGSAVGGAIGLTPHLLERQPISMKKIRMRAIGRFMHHAVTLPFPPRFVFLGWNFRVCWQIVCALLKTIASNPNCHLKCTHFCSWSNATPMLRMVFRVDVPKALCFLNCRRMLRLVRGIHAQGAKGIHCKTLRTSFLCVADEALSSVIMKLWVGCKFPLAFQHVMRGNMIWVLKMNLKNYSVCMYLMS